MHGAFVGIGANLGDAAAAIESAADAIGRLPETQVTALSSLYRSAPVGVPDAQPDYFNAVARLATRLDPQALLAGLQAIERAHGRVRGVRNAARTLDLDLLLYDTLELATPTLTLPHPRMHERAFVLEPLAEIAPGIAVPGRGPIAALREATSGQHIERLPHVPALAR